MMWKNIEFIFWKEKYFVNIDEDTKFIDFEEDDNVKREILYKNEDDNVESKYLYGMMDGNGVPYMNLLFYYFE